MRGRGRRWTTCPRCGRRVYRWNAINEGRPGPYASASRVISQIRHPSRTNDPWSVFRDKRMELGPGVEFYDWTYDESGHVQFPILRCPRGHQVVLTYDGAANSGIIPKVR